MTHYTPLYDSICTSGRMADLPDDACRLFYTWLLAKCDAWGRLDARPRKLNVEVWPLLCKSEEETSRALQALVDAGLVDVYEPDGGDPFVQVPDWEEKAGSIGRKSHRRASRFPDPDGLSCRAKRAEAGEPGQCRAKPGAALSGVGAGDRASLEGGSKGETKRAAWEAVLDDPEFAELRANLPWRTAWSEWVEHCRERGTKAKVPPGPRAKRIFRDALEDPARHAEAIRASIRNDWQGINPDWLKSGGSGRGRDESHGASAIRGFLEGGGSFLDTGTGGAQ